VHTGPYAAAFERRRRGDDAEVEGELEHVRAAGRLIVGAGMQFNAGHGLNYVNVMAIASLPGIAELHIGHSIVSRAVFTGLRAAVAEMKRLMSEAAAGGAAGGEGQGRGRPRLAGRRVREGATGPGGLS
jgi:pyridoxine 5-phosphate synthase